MTLTAVSFVYASLYRDPATPGVLTTPFIWDGRTSHQLEDPALGHAESADQGEIQLGD
jgi:hypothetical protein